MDEQQRQMVALFRYALVRQATDEQLTPRQRGALVRDLAAQDHDRGGRAAGKGL